MIHVKVCFTLILSLKPALLVFFRPVLLPGGGLFWLLCQQSQDTRVQRLYGAQLERGETTHQTAEGDGKKYFLILQLVCALQTKHKHYNLTK